MVDVWKGVHHKYEFVGGFEDTATVLTNNDSVANTGMYLSIAWQNVLLRDQYLVI